MICLFHQATGLERIFEELESVRLTLDKTKETQQMNKTKITMKHEVVVKLENELRELIALDKYDDQIAELAAKCFWCDVGSSRAAVTQVEKELSAATTKLDRISAKIASLQSSLAELGSTEAIERRVKELNEELSSAVEQLQSCEQRNLEATRTATSAEARIRNISNHINDFSGRLQGCEAEVSRLDFAVPESNNMY
jgi:chromosome segregation ATPase